MTQDTPMSFKATESLPFAVRQMPRYMRIPLVDRIACRVKSKNEYQFGWNHG